VRRSVENVTRKSQFDFGLVKLEKIKISTSAEILDVFNRGNMPLSTQLTQLIQVAGLEFN